MIVYDASANSIAHVSTLLDGHVHVYSPVPEGGVNAIHTVPISRKRVMLSRRYPRMQFQLLV